MPRDGAQDADGARGLHHVHAALKAVPGGDGRARRGGVFAREGRDDVGRHAADGRCPLGRVGDSQTIAARQVLGQALQAGVVGVAVNELAVPQTLVIHHVQHGQRQREVGAGLNLDELVGASAQVEVKRVDDHQLGAAVARVQDLPQHGRLRERGLQAPVDDEVGMNEVAKRRHTAVGHALGDGARHEALRRTHAHLGAHAVRQTLRHVVGEAPAACLTAKELDRPRPMRSHGLLHLPRKLGDGFVPADALEFTGMLFAHAAHRVQHATRVVRDLRRRQTLRAQHAVGLEGAGHAVRAQHLAVLHVGEHLARAVAPAAHRGDGDRPVGVGDSASGSCSRRGASVSPRIGNLEDGLPLCHGNRSLSRRTIGYDSIVAGYTAQRNAKRYAEREGIRQPHAFLASLLIESAWRRRCG